MTQNGKILKDAMNNSSKKPVPPKKNVVYQDLPEITIVGSKDKGTRDFYNDMIGRLAERQSMSTDNPYVDQNVMGEYLGLMNLGKQYGFPKIKPAIKTGIYKNTKGQYSNDTIYTDDIPTWVSEMAHHVQMKDNGFGKKLQWLGNDLVEYLKQPIASFKGEPLPSPYKKEGTVEHEAHSIIEPMLQKQIQEDMQKYKNSPAAKSRVNTMVERLSQKMQNGGEMIRRADGSYSRRGLWDNIRANKGSGKKPTKEMLEQERKIKNNMAMGGTPCYDCGGMTLEQQLNAYMAFGGGYFPFAEEGMYIVQAGDTLSKIAKRYNTSVKDLVASNNIANPNMINVSQRLAIPGYKEPAPVVKPAPVSSSESRSVIPFFATEDDRKAYQAKLTELASKALGEGSDESYLLNTSYHNIEDGNNCINGVCGLDLGSGLKFSNPTDGDRYLSNTAFAKAVADKQEDYYQVNGNFQIGDHLQNMHKSHTYTDKATGKTYEQRNVPFHSKKIYNITTHPDGSKRYHVIHNAGGKEFRENVYTEEELNNMMRNNEITAFRPGYALDKDKLAKERINMSPEAYQAYMDRQAMKSWEKAADPGYKYSIREDSPYANKVPEGMQKFIQYANNESYIDDLVDKLGVPKSVIHDELLNTFGELGQENKWEDPLVGGNLAPSFLRKLGAKIPFENTVEKALTSIGGGKNMSVGPGQIKFNELPEDLKKMFDIKKSKDLYNWDKVIPLMTAINIRNRQWLDRKGDKAGEYILGQEGLNSDQLPYDKGRYTPSLYRGLPPNILKKLTKEAEENMEGFRIPRKKKQELIQKYIQDHLAENQLQLADGSYADAVFDKIDKNLERVRTNTDPRGDVLPNISIVGKRKKANGGLINNNTMYSFYDMMAAGGINNPGFKALPGDVQEKIISNMAQGGEANGSMALGQMSAVADKMSKLRQFVNPEQNLDPWIASKLAVMDHSADAISDYLMYGPDAQQGVMKKGGSTNSGMAWYGGGGMYPMYDVAGPVDPPMWHSEWEQDPYAEYSVPAEDPAQAMWHSEWGQDPEMAEKFGYPDPTAAPDQKELVYLPSMQIAPGSSKGSTLDPKKAPAAAKRGSSSGSVVDFLNSQGAQSDFTTRKNVAEKIYGISDYKGTADQNKLLLEYLKGQRKPGQASQSSQLNFNDGNMLRKGWRSSPDELITPFGPPRKGVPNQSTPEEPGFNYKALGITAATAAALATAGLSAVDIIGTDWEKLGSSSPFNGQMKRQLTMARKKLLDNAFKQGAKGAQEAVAEFKRYPKRLQNMLNNLDAMEVSGDIYQTRPGTAMRNLEAWQMGKETAAEESLLRNQEAIRMQQEAAQEAAALKRINAQKAAAARWGKAAPSVAAPAERGFVQALREGYAAARATPLLKFLRKADGGNVGYYADGGGKDSLAENVVEFLDPTGISSWDDAYRTFNDPNAAWWEKGLSVAAALPVVGKVGKAAKVATEASKLRKAMQVVGKVATPVAQMDHYINPASRFVGTMTSKALQNAPKPVKAVANFGSMSNQNRRFFTGADMMMGYADGGHTIGQEIEITDPAQLMMLQKGGYTFEII